MCFQWFMICFLIIYIWGRSITSLARELWLWLRAIWTRPFLTFSMLIIKQSVELLHWLLLSLRQIFTMRWRMGDRRRVIWRAGDLLLLQVTQTFCPKTHSVPTTIHTVAMLINLPSKTHKVCIMPIKQQRKRQTISIMTMTLLSKRPSLMMVFFLEKRVQASRTKVRSTDKSWAPRKPAAIRRRVHFTRIVELRAQWEAAN